MNLSNTSRRRWAIRTSFVLRVSLTTNTRLVCVICMKRSVLFQSNDEVTNCYYILDGAVEVSLEFLFSKISNTTSWLLQWNLCSTCRRRMMEVTEKSFKFMNQICSTRTALASTWVSASTLNTPLWRVHRWVLLHCTRRSGEYMASANYPPRSEGI